MTALNGAGEVRRYPGSPWLIAQALGPADSYLACELGPEEHTALRETMRGRRNVRTLWADGYEAAAAQTQASGRTLVLIDPPFERPDDYRPIVATLAAVRSRNPRAVALVWLPLKDLETFDAFLRDFEDTVDVAGSGRGDAHAPLDRSHEDERLRPAADGWATGHGRADGDDLGVDGAPGRADRRRAGLSDLTPACPIAGATNYS